MIGHRPRSILGARSLDHARRNGNQKLCQANPHSTKKAEPRPIRQAHK